MKLASQLHIWRTTPQRGREIQRQLAPRVVTMALPRGPRLVAGADLAFATDGSRCLAVVVIWDVKARCVVEVRYAVKPVRFPYVPGLLSFREGPALLAAFRRVQTEPDVIMLDGHGVAHPRRFGLACHIGLWLDRPTLGCAKSLLIGQHGALGPLRGDRAMLKVGDEVVGTALRMRDHVKPIFVSIGHRIRLKDAVEVALACGAGYRLPEPTRLADQLVGQISKAPDVRLAWKRISTKMMASS